MISDVLLKRYYGDAKYDGTKRFYSLVRAAARPDARLLNLGAGPATKNPVSSLKGEVAELVGADIDDVVLENEEVDTAVVIRADELPFEDESFDLAFSDYVLEHVERPTRFLAEVRRVLKPGACFFFRTPNVFHYVGFVAAVTPHGVHAIANRMRGLPSDAHEPYPTFHRVNTRREIARVASAVGFRSVTLQMVECEPSYLTFHALPFLAGVAYERLVNSTEMLAGVRANIFGSLQR